MDFTARKEEMRFDHPTINRYLEKWKNDTVFNVSITRPKRTNSDPLRNYYWGKVIRSFMKLGYEPQDFENLHKHFKFSFFKPQPDELGIKPEPMVFSKKSKITVDQKWDFVEWVRRIAARQGLDIQDPDPNWRANKN